MEDWRHPKVRVVWEDKHSRVGKFVFNSTEVQVTHHAFDRFLERGGRTYGGDELVALRSMAVLFVESRPLKEKPHVTDHNVERTSVVWGVGKWRFIVDKSRNRLTTCYRVSGPTEGS